MTTAALVLTETIKGIAAAAWTAALMDAPEAPARPGWLIWQVQGRPATSSAGADYFSEVRKLHR